MAVYFQLCQTVREVTMRVVWRVKVSQTVRAAESTPRVRHMFDRIGDNFEFNQTALALRQQRQEVLAANIANADTPHFKARDFDFTKALQEAMGGGGSLRLPATELNLTSARHIPGMADTKGTAELLYRQPYQPSLDGNTVDMDVERVQFADNTARYQADLSIISARLKSLRSVFEQ